MANTITKTTVHDSRRRVIARIDILGDASGDEAATIGLGISALTPAPTYLKIIRIQASLQAFSVELYFDHTANQFIWTIPGNDQVDQFFPYGITDLKGDGGTGDILFDTTGLGAGEEGSIIIEATKHGIASLP